MINQFNCDFHRRSRTWNPNNVYSNALDVTELVLYIQLLVMKPRHSVEAHEDIHFKCKLTK